MNAIEIRGLTKNFGAKQVLVGLDMTVPQGAIYGFIGENGSGKSTTEKIVCGLIPKSGGTVKLYGRAHTDAEVRAKIGVLIEAPGCFPNYSVWNNMLLQAANLGIKNAQAAVRHALKIVRMEGSASNKFKNCSLGMKQRIGIAMALLGDPDLLILDEPINGLDADGMRIMREVLLDIARNQGRTVVISSHILGELEKIATHYGVIRHGKMIKEMAAAQLDAECRTYIWLRADNAERAFHLLGRKFSHVQMVGAHIHVFDEARAEEIVNGLYEQGVLVCEIGTEKVGLEEYYMDLMNGEGRR